jgi:hypothetical protein
MKPAFVKEIARDFAEALRANPLAMRDVQELLEALSLCHADFVSRMSLRPISAHSPISLRAPNQKPASMNRQPLELDRRAPPVE